jgi:hypothetical protein
MGNPADIDARIERLRPMLVARAPELEGAKFVPLVDRESGNAIGLAFARAPPPANHNHLGGE